ncbi:hypothetical protein KAFR_0A02220 [Kazachstania africana CBS 2517]|uniref:Sugar phosphate phosphatase n=1 Tax=Kazachstania africana (strain ATCC 22294 / BCRC 22015 / CBS 2517 / CECT 1963 / NBRC 1671 / NRRL Y-8276) TaxID=1071382 RepID=H2AMR0_KAZAF|nr:hypothetical protein KAFR_0A02220 [Kazachstania africana CBS 2517]CCF55660.1 hypothetical protein KAFR_0A02220 [Kazachstania africana CBS 2517]
MTASLPRRFLTSDQGTFGAYTASVRWPIIVQNIIDDLLKEVDTLNDDEIINQGKIIEEQLAAFRLEIINDAKLRKFTAEECEIASVPLTFNKYLDEHSGATWLNAEWLFTEIYLYRRVNVIFRLQSSKHWKSFDCFNGLKQSTFQASCHGVAELAIRYQNLLPQLEKSNHDEEVLKLLFQEFIEISLWGNATDLSLLTNATLEDIKSIQGQKAREESESKILINDTEKAWNQLIKSGNKSGKRVDFVLDNSGFELYADLMLAAFLLQSKLASECVFHAKDTPYMVSDTMIKDFFILLNDLTDPSFFSISDKNSTESKALNSFASDIRAFYDKEMITFEDSEFWTTDLDYWNIDGDSPILKELQKSDLVIFKGDLNYRKLTGDRTWSRTTPWAQAIGPLSSNGVVSLSLRTCKADVQVGLPAGLDENLTKQWEVDHPGQGSWWTCSGKWAVICFAASH